MGHKLLLAWTLLLANGVQGIRVQSQSLGEGGLSELDRTESAAKIRPWRGVLALVLAFSPAEALLGHARDQPGTLGNSRVVPPGLGTASTILTMGTPDVLRFEGVKYAGIAREVPNFALDDLVEVEALPKKQKKIRRQLGQVDLRANRRLQRQELRWLELRGGASMPKKAEAIATRSLELLEENLREDVNAYGQPWKVTKSSKDIEIWSSEIPGSSRRVWKSRYEFTTHAGLEEIIEEYRIWEKRLKWDTHLSHGEILKTFTKGPDICDVSRYVFKPVLTVAAREFVDLQCWHPSADGRTVVTTGASVTEKDMAGLPSPTKDAVRGDNKVGTGVRFNLLPSDGRSAGNRWEVFVVGDTDLKGLIPTWVINKAMAKTFNDVAKENIKHFATLERLDRPPTAQGAWKSLQDRLHRASGGVAKKN